MLISMNECLNYLRFTFGSDFKIEGVIHLGGCMAEEAQSYIENGVKRVVWIEGNKKLMKGLYDNANKFPMKQHYLCEVLSDTDGEKVTFNITDNQQSSSILSLGTHKIHHPQVKVIEQREVITSRFDTVYKKNAGTFDINDYSMINIDLQGMELRVLKGFGELLNTKSLRVIYSEVNTEYVYSSCCLITELDLFLESFGFKRTLTKLTEYGWGDALWARKT